MCFGPQLATPFPQDYSVEGLGLFSRGRYEHPDTWPLLKRQGGMVPWPLKESGVLGGSHKKQLPGLNTYLP